MMITPEFSIYVKDHKPKMGTGCTSCKMAIKTISVKTNDLNFAYSFCFGPVIVFNVAASLSLGTICSEG